jgi:hypothetical protein
VLNIQYSSVFCVNKSSHNVQHTIFLGILGKYFMLNTVGIFIYIKYWEIRYVEHCGNIYLHTILGNTLCWALWEDLFTQKIHIPSVLNIMYFPVFCVNKSAHSVQHNVFPSLLCNNLLVNICPMVAAKIRLVFPRDQCFGKARSSLLLHALDVHVFWHFQMYYINFNLQIVINELWNSRT